ncbi:hypothetical protein NDU88_000363, partial [Pleurodeles waltl]
VYGAPSSPLQTGVWGSSLFTFRQVCGALATGVWGSGLSPEARCMGLPPLPCRQVYGAPASSLSDRCVVLQPLTCTQVYGVLASHLQPGIWCSHLSTADSCMVLPPLPCR